MPHQRSAQILHLFNTLRRMQFCQVVIISKFPKKSILFTTFFGLILFLSEHAAVYPCLLTLKKRIISRGTQGVYLLLPSERKYWHYSCFCWLQEKKDGGINQV